MRAICGCQGLLGVPIGGDALLAWLLPVCLRRKVVQQASLQAGSGHLSFRPTPAATHTG